jgi:DNA-binding transcriptional regulator YiaG
MQNSITVYGLASSKDGVIRYIGQTSRPLATRMQWHLTWTKRERDKSRRTAWIKSVLRSGHALHIITIETDAVKDEAEMRWITHYRDVGHDLVNGSAGGDNCIGVPKTAEHRAKIAAALTGRKSPWTSERNRATKGKPGHPSTPETNAKISAAHLGKLKPSTSERNRTIEWTPEMRAKIREANRRLSDDDIRQIKAMLAAGVLQTVIAAQFNVSVSTISGIKRGKKFPDIL